MIGGAISGYWAIGKRKKETAPTMTKTIETTEAKIGRSMKNWEIPMLPDASAGPRVRVRRRRWCALFAWGHFGALAGAHQPVDDDAIFRRQAFLDDAQVAGRLPQRHVFQARDIVGVGDQHEFARLLGADSGIGYQQRLIGRRARYLEAPEHAGREKLRGIVEY